MLSRDFVRAFLIGQLQSGVTAEQAKENFKAWLRQETTGIATEQEKAAIINDLDSYGVN